MAWKRNLLSIVGILVSMLVFTNDTSPKTNMAGWKITIFNRRYESSFMVGFPASHVAPENRPKAKRKGSASNLAVSFREGSRFHDFETEKIKEGYI